MPRLRPQTSSVSLLALLSLALFRHACAAQPLQLANCIASALQNSPALAALRSQTQAAAAAYARDRSSLWPTLTLAEEASYSSFGPQSSFSDGPENKGNADLGLDLQRLLSSPSTLSRLDLQRCQLLLTQAQGQLRHDVTQTYYKILVLLRKSLDQRQATDFVDSHIRDIERLQSSGLDVALDLLRARSQRKSLDLTALHQSGDLQNALAALRSWTGLSLDAADFDVESGLTLTPSSGDDSTLLADALLQTQQARLAALDLQSAEGALQGLGRFSAPSLHLGLDHSFQAIDPNTPTERLYGSLSFNAFDWGQQNHATQQVRLALEAQQSALKEQRRTQRLAAAQLSQDLANARQAYTLTAGLVQDAQAGLEIAKTYYRQGKAKESDLLSVFADYLTALDQRDEALLSVLNQEADWDALWNGVQR
jgi:outer membrane protein TolC